MEHVEVTDTKYNMLTALDPCEAHLEPPQLLPVLD